MKQHQKECEALIREHERLQKLKKGGGKTKGAKKSAKKEVSPKSKSKAAKSSPKAAAGSPKGSNKGKKLSKVTPTPPRTGMWADEEHDQFKEGVVLYGEHLICGI